MKVRELVEALRRFDPDQRVALKDPDTEWALFSVDVAKGEVTGGEGEIVCLIHCGESPYSGNDFASCEVTE